MNQVRARGLAISLLTSAFVMAAVSDTHADVVVFATGRTMTVTSYRISGDVITVLLKHGGEASFAKALVTRIEPDEVIDELVAESDSAPSDVALAGGAALDGRPFAALVETAARHHGVDPALVHAVIQTESNYRPLARSPVGARGLMQVMPATGRDLGVKSATSLFDPRANIDVGVRYLKALLDRYNGDLTFAIAAYNAGPGAVARYRGIPPFPETQNYVRRVLANLQH